MFQEKQKTSISSTFVVTLIVTILAAIVGSLVSHLLEIPNERKLDRFRDDHFTEMDTIKDLFKSIVKDSNNNNEPGPYNAPKNDDISLKKNVYPQLGNQHKTTTGLINEPTLQVLKTEKPIFKKEIEEFGPNAHSMRGSHFVIAGSFSTLEKAQLRIDFLVNNGYKNAEIIHFDLSNYYYVIADTKTEINAARLLVKELKDLHKIDAYVRIGG